MPPRRRFAALSSAAWPSLAALLAMVPVSGALSATNVFFVRDLGMFFWPRHLWLIQTFGDGNSLWWDPHPAGGQSTLPDALNQFFLLPATLVRLLLPPVLGFNFWVAAPLPIVAAGTWLWLARHVSAPAAAVGAAIASVAGPSVSGANFPNLSWTVALIPWVLWSVDRLGERRGARRVTALAVCVGLQAAAGEPVTFAGTCAVALGYAGFAMPPAPGRDRRDLLLRTAGALAAGVLLAAVQLVPLALAARRSMRGVAIDATFWSLHPLSALEALVPHLFGHAYHVNAEALPWMGPLNAGREPLFYSLYVGIGACALALVRPADPAATRWRRVWWLIVGASLIAAFGEHTPVYSLLQRVAPMLESLRFPVKYVVFTAFGVAALAASGADALLRHRGTEEGVMRRPVRVIAALGATSLLAALVGLGSMADAPPLLAAWEAAAAWAGVADPIRAAAWLKSNGLLWVRLAVLAATVAFMLELVWRRHRAAAISAWIVCAIAVLDPLAVNADLHPTQPAAALGPPEWVEATRTHPTDRVYIGGRVTPDDPRRVLHVVDAPGTFDAPAEWSPPQALTYYGTRLALTPSPWKIRELISHDLPKLWPREYVAMLARFRDAGAAERLRFLRRTGHRYCYVQAPPVPGARPLAAPGLMRPMALYACGDDPRRVYITGTAVVEPSLGRQLDLLFLDTHDPFAAVLLERPAPAAAGRPGDAAAEPSAGILREGTAEVVVRAAVGDPGGYLNLVDSYDPNWIVEVDGRRAALLRANGLFRAVHLAPGVHDVRFVYRPIPLYIGLALTCPVGLLLLGACLREK